LTVAVLVVFLILALTALFVGLLTGLTLTGLIVLLALSGLSRLTGLLTFLFHIVCHATSMQSANPSAPQDFINI
jgi:hypothetical protein